MNHKTIFITGAGAGIGRATAALFAARGWRVGAYDVNEHGVQELQRQYGDAVIAGRADVTDAEALRRAVEEFSRASGGRLDLMFNNAGIAQLGDFESVPVAKSHAIVDVNVKGVINGAYAALPHLQRTPKSRMISMCSHSALYGAAQLAVYSATKFAVKGLTEALDIEWGPRYGIKVMDLCPLFVDTPMVHEFAGKPFKAKDQLGVRLTADDVAARVWTLATRWRWACPVHTYPGIQGKFLAGAAKLSPSFLNRAMNKLVQA